MTDRTGDAAMDAATKDSATGTAAAATDSDNNTPGDFSKREYTRLRKDKPPSTEEQEYLKKRSTAKMIFTKKVNLFRERQTKNDPYEALKICFNQIEDRFKILESICFELVEYYTQNSFNQIFIDETLEYSNECEKIKYDMYLLLLESKTNMEKSPSEIKNTKPKLEPIKLPHFSGKIRDYPSFVEDFNKIVVPAYGKHPSILKQCLGSEALEVVRNRDSDFEVMMTLLDSEYGDPRKIVQAVVYELRKLNRVYDDDSEGFIRLIRTVHSCYTDLSKVNMQSEISNVNIVNDLEDLLPKEPRQRWIRLSRNITDKNQLFPKLLDFLLAEKQDLEKWMSSTRRKEECVKVNSTRITQYNETDSKIVDFMNNTTAVLEKLCNKISEMDYKPSFKDRDNRGGVWCYYHNFHGHTTANCGKFRTLSPAERFDVIKRKNVCYVCFFPGHSASSCSRQMGCNVRIEGVICNQRHHALLHEHFFRHNNAAMGSNIFSSASKVLLETSLAFSGNIPVSILWDSGAQGSLITHRKAKELGAVGVPISGPMGGVGDFQKWIRTKEYKVKLQDLWGNTHEIICAGMDEVAGRVTDVDVKKIAHLFPEFNLSEMIRPSGYCDLLIGNDYCWLHPRPVAEVGKLQLMESPFGYSIRGLPPDNMCGTSKNEPIFNNLCMDLQPDNLKENLDNLFRMESAGIQAPIKEENPIEKIELELIERGLRYDDENKIWIASMPWIQDPEILPDNYKAILGRLQSLEKKLLCDKALANAYQREIQDMLDRGVARLLNKNEIYRYSGPKHYIAHFGVPKPESLSTPLRIVFDPTSQFMGHRLNEFWAKGPNFVNNLFVVLLRFRKDVVGLVGDVSKMYHSVHLDIKDQHVHRFLWRDLNVNSEPQIFTLTRVTFGDRPSGALATIAMQYTSLMYQEKFPEVVDVIFKNTYVDDILPNSNSRENAEILAKHVDIVLAEGNFHVKNWVISGDPHSTTVDVDMSKEQGQKVLGMRWCPKSDEFSYTVQLNFSPKHRGVRSGKVMTKEDCTFKFPQLLTRRMVVSQIATVFDPYGFLLPYTLKSKLMLRRLVTMNSDVKENNSIRWDEPLNEMCVNEWRDYFLGLFDIERLSFPRSVKPACTVKDPMLIMYSDASQSAYGCCAYVRWKCEDDTYQARLIAAKGRIAPKQQQSIPRLELAGAVLAVRLRETIVNEMNMVFEEIIHVVDSTIVRAQIQKESSSFKMYEAVRVSEIQEKSNPSEWWWTESKFNVADLTTKPCSPDELGKDSEWQEGPYYLKEKRTTWPLSQKRMDEQPDVTEKLEINLCMKKHMDNVWDWLEFERFSSFSKLVRVIAIVMGIIKTKTFNGEHIIMNKWIPHAEKKLIIEAQKNLGNWTINFRSLGPFKDDDIIFVGSRIKQWLKTNWNAGAYILLPTDHPISHLIILELHNQTHEGVETTLCKLLSKFWIPKARKLIKRIKSKCVKCRILEKKPIGQCMGQVSDNVLKPAPPFYHSATDIFGPFTIKDSVKRRTHGKCYGILFTCLVMRAVHVEMAEDYSTEAFLGAFRRFTSIRGFPKSMHSDNGSQLIAANKELIQISNDINKKAVGEFATKHKMDWSFNRSSDAPWLNASCESLIKSVKINLQKTINDSVLTFPELQTVMYEVANLVNSRPIGMKPGNDISLGIYLSPNDLLLGRNDRLAPVGVYDPNPNPKFRFRFIESLVTNFWRRWQRDYFPQLIIQKKWHVKSRNVQVGDIVLVQDANTVRGDWRLGEVVQTNSGRDHMVRDVTVRYKISTQGSMYKGSKNKFLKRSVHKLVVVLPIEER